MEQKKKRYAIGQQDFRSLRERGAVYADKTQYIEKIINGDNQYQAPTQNQHVPV